MSKPVVYNYPLVRDCQTGIIIVQPISKPIAGVLLSFAAGKGVSPLGFHEGRPCGWSGCGLQVEAWLAPFAFKEVATANNDYGWHPQHHREHQRALGQQPRCSLLDSDGNSCADFFRRSSASSFALSQKRITGRRKRK